MPAAQSSYLGCKCWFLWEPCRNLADCASLLPRTHSEGSRRGTVFDAGPEESSSFARWYSRVEFLPLIHSFWRLQLFLYFCLESYLCISLAPQTEKTWTYVWYFGCYWLYWSSWAARAIFGCDRGRRRVLRGDLGTCRWMWREAGTSLRMTRRTSTLSYSAMG